MDSREVQFREHQFSVSNISALLKRALRELPDSDLKAQSVSRDLAGAKDAVDYSIFLNSFKEFVDAYCKQNSTGTK